MLGKEAINTSSDLENKLTQLTPAQRKRLRQSLGQSSVNGNELIAQVLNSLGITHVYGISGIPVDKLLGSCAVAGIRVIGNRHQQGSVLMAAAHNYAAGKLASAVIVSSGPAITNTLTGVLTAWDNAWPLLVIGGGCHGAPPGTFQQLNAVPLFQESTKASVLISSSDQIVSTITHAAQLAMENRPGPVFIEIAPKVFNQSESLPLSITPDPLLSPPIDEENILKAVEILKQAKRPLLVIGKGIRWSKPYQELTELARQGIPFITSPMGRGYLPDDAPGNVTPTASLALSTADVILSVGARWNWTFRFGAELGLNAKLIQIDIHASEIGRNLEPAVGIVGDAKLALQALVNQLKLEGWQPKAETKPWCNRLEAACIAKHQQWSALINQANSPITLQALFSTVAESLPRDAITVLDGNFTLEAGLQLLPCYTPASRFTPGSNGCMGSGVPFALGAKMAYPDRIVVAVCGDLAFGMTAMELETAVRHQLPVVIIVANNQGSSGSYRQQKFYGPHYPERVTMFVPDARYDLLATAFGGLSADVGTASEFRSALMDAITASIPTCINVRLDPDAPSPRL